MATSLNPTTTTQFPVFFPPARHHQPQRPPTEIRFSRWNNANAQKFKTNQKELEDQIRFQKRFDSALTIAHNYNPAPPQPITSPTTTKSTGTPSSPSSPSIPAKKSKYSRQRQQQQHPAFAKPLKKIPVTQKDIIPQNPTDVSIRVDENGVCYELPEAPFVYQYSYTETPKMKPVKLREPLVSPFGAGTMPRPWTGKKPMTKKELPEFDSFRLPPPGKKGVKSIQSPGPFLAGSGPKDVRDREEVLGAPLTKEEVDELVKGCMKTNRQLNIGRDGLTHNMLDNIHALWKRRRVCKIKCKGVCTVDMDIVCKQLEEKTGGKIIYNKGGIVYLFRGRNYNYKYRPRFPLMLWKPVAPVYPRLVQRVPDGLTLEEANEMRRKGRDLTPICKLAKNGLYCDLVKNVREAFEACELVRINCQGLNPSDYKKIGAKLKDLVPCVLMSFENEHILVWRGQDWKSSFDEPLISPTESHKEDVVASPILTSSLKSVPILSNGIEETSPRINDEEPLEVRAENGIPVIKEGSTEAVSASESVDEFNILEFTADHSEAYNQTNESIEVEPSSVVSEPVEAQPEKKLDVTNNANEVTKTISPYINGVLLLRNQAVESGMAYVLDDNSLDADIVFRKAVDFAKTAPQGPVFIQRRKQSAAQKTKDETEPKEDKAILGTEITVSDRRIERNTNRNRNSRFADIKEDYLNVVPQGHLRVDELAKLLA